MKVHFFHLILILLSFGGSEGFGPEYDPEHCYEENWGYTGDSLNDASADTQVDWKSCKNFCSTSYNESDYFTHQSSDNKCWCRMARGPLVRRPNGRHESVGTISGELSDKCIGMLDYQASQNGPRYDISSDCVVIGG